MEAETNEYGLEEYRKKKFNVLVPSQTMKTYSDMHEPVLEQVSLSADADDGDIYVQEKGNQNKPSKYALSKQGLMKLASCAGIMWHPTETRRTDDRSDKNYVSYQAIGGVQKNDGSWIWFKAEYDLDFEDVEMEIEEQYRGKQEKYEADREAKWWHKKTEDEKEAYIQSCIRRDLLQKRKHKLKLAESGAMNRVVRALLGVKNHYTAKELAQPFVVARVVFRPDYSDPTVRQELTRASIEAVTSIYGPRRAPATGTRPFAPTGDMPPQAKTRHSFVDVDFTPEDEQVMPDEEEPSDLSGEMSSQESQAADFRTLDKGEKIKTLSQMMVVKGYDRQKLTKPLAQYSEEAMDTFFDRLLAMPETGEQIPT